MPEKETESSFDAAAEVARPELEELLEGMTEEERSGAKKVLSWQKLWYLQARPQALGPHYRLQNRISVNNRRTLIPCKLMISFAHDFTRFLST